MPKLDSGNKKGQTTKRGAKGKEKKSENETLYPKVVSEVRDSENPITYMQAKDMLGWEEEPEGESWGADYLFVTNGRKIRCTNNIRNRPLNNTSLNTLKQQFLRNRWRMNGEPIIVGKTGSILNGQHTLISFVLAVEEYREDSDKWTMLAEEPVLIKLVVYGIEESDEVVNTMDTCKPRTLWEVLCRAEYFATMGITERKVSSKIAENAIKMLWYRTATHANAFAVRRTHAESIAFLDSHPKLLDAVSFIKEENGKEGRIAKYLSPGYATAALYLMAVSATDPQGYYLDEVPNESLLDLSRWDKACEFFVELAAGGKQLNAVRQRIDALITDGSVSIDERWTVLAKAWDVYLLGKTITPKDVLLDFQVEDGERKLLEVALFGGIDIGEEGLQGLVGSDPTPEEIEQAAAKIRKKRQPETKVAAQVIPGKWSNGDKAWVHDYDGQGNSCFGTIGKPYKTSGGEYRVLIDAEDGNWEVKLDDLSLKEFEKVAS